MIDPLHTYGLLDIINSRKKTMCFNRAISKVTELLKSHTLNR